MTAIVSLLTDSLWVWLGVGGFFLVAGSILASALGRERWRFFGIGIGLTVIALGVICVFFVTTDRKSIRRAIYGVAAAIGRNNIQEVLTYIDESAVTTRGKAAVHMGRAEIESARVGQLNIKSINYYTSPPMATVVFNGGVRGRERHFGSGFSILVHFEEVELVKGADGVWRITDQCHFRYPGYNGD